MSTNTDYDIIVIGAGVIGASTAYHLARLGAKRVLVLEQGQIGAGTGSQSSGILRTHYSVPENVAMARLSWDVFKDFPQYLDDPQADSGLVQCGYLIAAGQGEREAALHETIEQQRSMGIELEVLDAKQARELLPIAQFEEAELIAYEPLAGFADPYLVNTAFARNARRLGVKIREGVQVQALVREGNRITGVQTADGSIYANHVISTQNIWAHQLQSWLGVTIPLVAERHTVLALETPSAPYTQAMPVFKDMISPGMLYLRSYGGNQMLVSEGVQGEQLSECMNEQGDIDLDEIVAIGEQVGSRFPEYMQAQLASSWTGVYDVTPDWNPVLGELPGIEGLTVGFGFSGHGFKLSPAVGLLLAQQVLQLQTGIDILPYSFERFASGKLLVGKYGAGAVS